MLLFKVEVIKSFEQKKAQLKLRFSSKYFLNNYASK
jgi:hypothetical protein